MLNAPSTERRKMQFSLQGTFTILKRIDDACPGLTMGALVAHIRLSRDASMAIEDATRRVNEADGHARLAALSTVASLTESARLWDAVERGDEDGFVRAVSLAHGRTA